MTDKLFSGKWEGHYSLGMQYPEQRQKDRVGFFAEISVGEGVLSGICEEYITKVHLKKPAKLAGFIDGNLVTFVKRYSCYYFVDDEKKIRIDFSRPAHPIYYSGIYDVVSGIVSGEWKIEISPESEIADEVVPLSTGTWQMRKIQPVRWRV